MISDLAGALSANRTDYFRPASEAGMMALSPVSDAIMPAHSAAGQRIRRMAPGTALALRLHE